ncbi:Metallo-hydrolase/oxidoreductase [Aaosphaeria arxii CBS 175.79]|uniref:Metallo-hydrolase/oxidoreductase n=1 Tax=Aaosphaeria arxii CBS 175.79 TaxID=1450172 RepID=A0A6A5XXG0_9PLEO|nr:Metallo-hydrolase/oxidoreductase [Aaosphaeria arxii CBS 175.79]KAF2018025.1 Metallo-hydrolase/oxidoreductase [Aaosphaeria arxii CBS 175.79]
MAYEPSFQDRQDFEDASHGFVAALSPGIIKQKDGRVVWNIDEYDFMKDECPATANPKLWRQGQLNSMQGLYEIAPSIYQVRAFDLSNMSIIEGKEGIIVVDPLISNECAKAALEIYQEHRDPEKKRKVTGMIYSHSHGDHYMGAGGILGENPQIPIIAPDGFIEAVMSESILAGPAMRQRAWYMYGNGLPRSPTGQIGVGLGMGSSKGNTSLIPPNLLIKETGEEHIVDGVRIIFQMVPETEAPAEVNFFFPDLNALCVPETATNCMHNIVTLRGAQVRDAKAWSGYLDEVVQLFGRKADVLFGSHNWPTWGRSQLTKRLNEQRDMYAYLHDQTVRMMNLGMTGTEIAEQIVLPPALARAWHCQGFYGSVSHNVKGIYQKYMTWFDGNPAHLWSHPRAAEGQRYVECFGGVDALCLKASEFASRGDLRFAATLLDHAVAGFPEVQKPRVLLSEVYQKLGFGAENATWRNFYLTAAQELTADRSSAAEKMVAGGRTPLGPNLDVGQWFDILSIQINGEVAAERDTKVRIEFNVIDENARWTIETSNGVIIHRKQEIGQLEEGVDLSLRLTKIQLLNALRGGEVDCESQSGRTAALKELLDLTRVETGAARGPSQL